LTTKQVLRTISAADWNGNLVGMDVVEVCPAYDHSGITSLAAATVIQHVLQADSGL
jgi:agmatinase